MICPLQASESGKLWCNSVWVQRPENGGSDGVSSTESKPPENWKWEYECLCSSRDWFHPSFFYSGLNRSDELPPYQWGLSSLLIQMLFSSQGTLTDTLRYVCQLSGHFLTQTSLVPWWGFSSRLPSGHLLCLQLAGSERSKPASSLASLLRALISSWGTHHELI